jgi:diguanylate cyclase (GGDEF)-like protein
MVRLTAGALPLAQNLRPAERRALAAAFAVLLGILAFVAAHVAFDLGGRAVEQPIRDWLTSVVYVLVAAVVVLRAVRSGSSRRSWSALALGISVYGAGNLLWAAWVEHLPNPPIPSVCDALWLALYPLSYVGIVGLARGAGSRHVSAGALLDGIIAGAGIAAVGATLSFRVVLQKVGAGSIAAATELAYPIGDLLLAGLVIAVLSLRGWRVDRTWAMLAAGFVMLATADCLYGVQAANGSASPSALDNLFYILGVALLAFSAWQAEVRPVQARRTSISTLLVPATFTLSAIVLLVLDRFYRLDPFALGLAIVAVAAWVARTAIAFRDIRELAEARHQATTDELTSLPNRRELISRACASIEHADLGGGVVSVLMLDLDNFKQLNVTLGHPAGDALLCRVGPRVAQVLRTSDTVARLGGDEFGVLLDPAPAPDQLAPVAEKLLGALQEPFEVLGVNVRMTASIGIATFPADAADAEELLKCAEVAMHLAKSSRAGYESYERERDTNSRERLLLAGELARALERNELELHYQPIASAASRRIVAAEALVRWRREDGTLLFPGHFVDAAEQAGLSRSLTKAVLELALRQLAAWRSDGRTLHLAINTTVADLLDTTFPGDVGAALSRHGLPPDALTLEVTERSVLSDPDRIGHVLAELAELGVRMALDDFGTGFSSLSHLRTLPVSEVKVDRAFVGRMCIDPADAAIVYATTELAHKLGMHVVAEGIEDEETWRAVTELGCERIQGYALSKPVPAAEFEALLPELEEPDERAAA